MLKRVVLLGSSGFVGKNLLPLLVKKEIETLSFNSTDLDLTQSESILKLKKELRPDDSLVFISAITPDRGRDAATLIKNLKMAENVGLALQDTPIGHFVYISSDALYDETATLVTEATPCHPLTFHGYMHQGRELILKASLAKLNPPTIFLRPTGVYGPGDTHNSYGPNRFVRTAMQERKINLFGNGEEKRDHLFIEDLSRLIFLCLEIRKTGALNIATGNAVSFRETAETVSKILENKTHVKTEIIGSKRMNPITHKHFDITQLIKTFPSFRFHTLEEGLAKMISHG